VSQLHSTRHLQTMSLCLFAKLILPDLPQAKPWRRANSLRPSISITEGWSDQRERNPKENATCRNKSHFLLNLGFNLDIFQW